MGKQGSLQSLPRRRALSARDDAAKPTTAHLAKRRKEEADADADADADAETAAADEVVSLCAPATADWVDPADKSRSDIVETKLRAFDLETKFGPCLGITRMERWERAQRLGKKPPAEVKALLEENHERYQKSIWEGRT